MSMPHEQERWKRRREAVEANDSAAFRRLLVNDDRSDYSEEKRVDYAALDAAREWFRKVKGVAA
jgi:hypothetical protein